MTGLNISTREVGIALWQIGTPREPKKSLHSRQLKVSIRLGHSKQALIPDESSRTVLGKAVIREQGLIQEISGAIKTTIA